jgi:hypothetical protein
MRIAAICTLASLVSLNALADTSFTIVNNSFELPAVATGSDTNGSATGWGSFGSMNAWGVFNPVISTNVNAVPDGSQVLYINPEPSGGGVLQDLTSNGNSNPSVQADTTYQLTVDIGARNDIGLPASYGIEIEFDLAFVNSNTCAPSAGSFVACTVTFDSALAPSDIGQDIGIAVFAQGDETSQVLFDNAQFSAQSDTPEPASMVLVITALTLFAAARHGSKSSR